MPILFLLLSSLPAFAATPAPPTPAPALTEEHLVEVSPFGGKAENTVFAVVMSCWPTDTNPQLKYAPNMQELAADAHAAADALGAREDTRVVRLFNPTLAEFDATIDGIRAELGENGQYMKLNFLYAGLAKGGDTNDEVALCPGGIPWSDITGRLKPLSNVAIGVLDASHDVSKSTTDLGPTFGFTANDWRDADMPDGFAISAGPEGKYTGTGLLTAFAKTVTASNGGTMSMGDLILGLRTNAPLLELALSTGVDPKDQWTDNAGRQVFPGGGLKKSVIALPTTGPSMPKKKIPSGCYMAGAGVLSLIGTGITAGQASTYYDKLVLYNNEGGESQSELDEAADGYRTNTVLAVSLGVLGSAALIGGTTWTIIDHGHTTVEVVPTSNGVMIGGTF